MRSVDRRRGVLGSGRAGRDRGGVGAQPVPQLQPARDGADRRTRQEHQDHRVVREPHHGRGAHERAQDRADGPPGVEARHQGAPGRPLHRHTLHVGARVDHAERDPVQRERHDDEHELRCERDQRDRRGDAEQPCGECLATAAGATGETVGDARARGCGEQDAEHRQREVVLADPVAVPHHGQARQDRRQDVALSGERDGPGPALPAGAHACAPAGVRGAVLAAR